MATTDVPNQQRGYWLALGFATTVTMWAVAYLGRLPIVMAPSWLLAALMMSAVVFWGWVGGARTGGGWWAGVAAGATTAVLNLLILGSLLAATDGSGVRPSAVLWIPGSILVVAVVAGAMSAAGSRFSKQSDDTDWTAVFSKVAVAATFLLVIAGGLVTSQEAGLAVIDWPNTFGYNMFLYPLSRMTGGIYFEHAHRLFGALVGLTVIALAVHLARVEPRRWVRRLALLAVALVVFQGMLGGLRVTGGFTLSTAAADMAPNIVLAVIHGVLGQVVLGVLVGLAVVTSVLWRRSPPPEARASARTDRVLQGWLVATLVVQLVFGAVQRHVAEGLTIHITLAAVVTVLALGAGSRMWSLYYGVWPLQRLGQLVMAVVTVQLSLGIAALAVTQGQAVVGNPTPVEVSLTTAHQATGALLLVISVMLALWTRRLFDVAPGGPLTSDQ